MSTIFAIDPGNIESGYAIIEMPAFSVIEAGKVNNNDLLSEIPIITSTVDMFAVEMIASYGMAVGKDIFETCVWIGRFLQASSMDANIVYRKDEKLHLCGDLRAKDTNIKQALINRFAKFDFKTGKGTKKNPDTFHGVSKDAWQAIAVGVTAYEKENI